MNRRDPEPESWDPLVKIPADVEQSDKLAWNLTARQLVQLGLAGIALWALWQASRPVLPPLVFAIGALPVAAVSIAVVLGRRDGIGMDRWLGHWLRHRRAPLHLLPAPLVHPADGLAELPLPVTGLDADGALTLSDGCAVLSRTETVNFALRTPGEQRALVAALGRWLNALTGPVQILVRTRRLDLAPMIAALRESAPTLPHPLLEDAAGEHADFLGHLSEGRDLLARDVLLVHREDSADPAARQRVLRRAADSGSLLVAAEVGTRVLDAHQAWSALSAACDGDAPMHPRPAVPSKPVTLEGER
ncbi:PrgI family protein [Streptacidiphilus pinicola]|uniref:PrgI family protein n=1 Tax=Streptacidiphilus pinicola TaxID=2219663 RepID=UPI001A9D46D4|nr:PrgI family protein [Streptacidiphilus pinicola]